MHLILILALMLPPQANAESAFAKIGAERNPDVKKKLALSFEKSFPTSKYLPEVYLELSRTIASQGDYAAAKEYAEKAVTTVTKMKTRPAPPENTDATWHQWLNTIDE